MHNNYFDIVMAHIEENVTLPTNEIKREIPKLIGRHARAFNESFSLITGYTLEYYIKQRKLHYAARELVISREKSICDIALEYQFSDQPAFSRAIKARYKFTPSQIRKDGFVPADEPFSFQQFSGDQADTRTQQILQRLQVGHMDVDEMEFWAEIDEVNSEFELDIDTCCLIIDLSERLEVPFPYLYHACIHAMIAVQNDPNHLSEADLRSIQLGIDSDEEEAAICAYFGCEPRALNSYLVEVYRERHK